MYIKSCLSVYRVDHQIFLLTVDYFSGSGSGSIKIISRWIERWMKISCTNNIYFVRSFVRLCSHNQTIQFTWNYLVFSFDIMLYICIVCSWFMKMWIVRSYSFVHLCCFCLFDVPYYIELFFFNVDDSILLFWFFSNRIHCTYNDMHSQFKCYFTFASLFFFFSYLLLWFCIVNRFVYFHV